MTEIEKIEADKKASMEMALKGAVIRSRHYDNYSIHQVGAGLGGEAFLLRTKDGATALFDTGFPFCADQTLKNIYDVTGGEPVDYIVLTHSHYDHCGATNYLREHMPSAKVAASEYAAYVFTRPGAYKTMEKMNDSRAVSLGYKEYEHIKEEIPVDIVLKEGDTLRVGDLEFEAIAAVGHTKCCMAFWCEEEGLFVSSETSGVVCANLPSHAQAPEDVKYMIDLIALVGFNSMLEHIERVRQLPIRTFVATHYGCITGEDVAQMWYDVDYWKDTIVNMVAGMHKEGKPIGEIIDVYKNTFYWGGTAPYQPEPAFDLNVSYALPCIIRDVCGEEPNE